MVGNKKMRDILAVWYTVTDPRIPMRCESYEFGYNQVYNGIGVFVYQVEDKLRIVAQQDLGVERVDMRMLDRKF
jgi:hypothetical protein